MTAKGCGAMPLYGRHQNIACCSGFSAVQHDTKYASSGATWAVLPVLRAGASRAPCRRVTSHSPIGASPATQDVLTRCRPACTQLCTTGRRALVMTSAPGDAARSLSALATASSSCSAVIVGFFSTAGTHKHVVAFCSDERQGARAPTSRLANAMLLPSVRATQQRSGHEYNTVLVWGSTVSMMVSNMSTARWLFKNCCTRCCVSHP